MVVVVVVVGASVVVVTADDVVVDTTGVVVVAPHGPIVSPWFWCPLTSPLATVIVCPLWQIVVFSWTSLWACFPRCFLLPS